MKNKYMNSNSRHAAMACASILGSAVSSQAAVLWSDNFNSYADGSLNHVAPAGGTGFPGTWFSGGATVTTGVVTSGQQKRELGSTFGSHGPTIWVSFDWGHDGGASNSYGGLTFYKDGILDADFRAIMGNTFGSNTWGLNGAGASTVSTTGMKTAVARFTLGTGSIDLWVGTGIGTVDVSGSPTLSATGLPELSGINRIRINGENFGGGSNSKFDNLIIGTTMLDVNAIPEPSTALLGGLGLLALLRRRR